MKGRQSDLRNQSATACVTSSTEAQTQLEDAAVKNIQVINLLKKKELLS